MVAAARSTQQLIEVVWTEDVSVTFARSTQQLIEVIYVPAVSLEQSVASVITFTDEAIQREDPGSTVALAQEVVVGTVLNLDVGQTIVLTQVPLHIGIFPRAFADIVFFGDSAGQINEETASNTLTITQDTSLLGRAASHILALTQLAEGERTVLGGAVDDVVTFTDAIALDTVLTIEVIDTFVPSDVVESDAEHHGLLLGGLLFTGFVAHHASASP